MRLSLETADKAVQAEIPNHCLNVLLLIDPYTLHINHNAFYIKIKRKLHYNERYIEIPIKVSKQKINNLYLHFLVTKKQKMVANLF